MITRPTSQRDQAMLLVSVVALAGVFAYWYFLYQPKAASLAAMATRIETLEASNQRAKVMLARGSVDSLDRQQAELDENLRLMRSLIPTGNEVPALLDQILAAARRNSLELGDFAPSETVTGTTFDTYGFRLSLRGTYHEIGEVLAAIASLRRIIVPGNVTLTPATTPGRREAPAGEQMLTATFDVQTYVVRTGVAQ
ncbi:MAG: type 4a pilus biogenesis protein PilO [Candidatus Nanopelagicales bacterium]